jgi:asparagine synthase (glutamine-hydrolysing)
MCGICGLVEDEGLSPQAEGWVREMARRQLHRGPDDEGFFFDAFAGLGSRRLSIVDVAGGRQPIGSESGAIQVVYNGEIYNHREIRRELERQGHRFGTSSDTEILVHLFEESGVESFPRLNGIFAFALWDAPRRTLFLVRDPIGVKPLYYWERDGRIAFASEVKALLALPFISAGLDEEALDLYLTFRFVPSPRTLFKGIRKLGPGEMLVKTAGKESLLRRYAPPPPEPDPGPSEEEWSEAIGSALRQAVHRQMMGDVPVGVLLSGGLDSAAVLFFASQIGGEPLRSYTVGFAEAPREDEVVAAAETARLFGSEHLHVTLGAAAYRECLMPSAFHLDEPVATPSVAPYEALCALAAKGHKVVLCGQGADEPFGGYARHLGEKLAGSPLGPALGVGAKLASFLFPRSERAARSGRMLERTDPLSRFAETFTLFPPEERQRLRSNGFPVDLARSAVLKVLEGTEHLDPLARFLYLDSRFSLSDDLLLYGDKIAMAHSLEVRVPFLDLEFLRLVETIPASLRVSLLRPKRLLRRALKNSLPSSILARPKRNFSPPDSTWMDSSLPGPSLQWLLEPEAAVPALCRREEVARLIREQREGKRDHRRQLFALLAFELWFRSFLYPGRLRNQ